MLTLSSLTKGQITVWIYSLVRQLVVSEVTKVTLFFGLITYLSWNEGNCRRVGKAGTKKTL